MSVVSLVKDDSSKVSIGDLRRVAASNNITLGSDVEEQDYLILLQSGDAVVSHVDSLPDYIPSALEPVPIAGGTRTYWRPSTQENPLNAWSHRCEFSVEKPSSDLLKGRGVAFKDNVSIGGLPTTLGTFAELLSKDGQYPISPIDATVVSRVLEAGGVVKGTATCENYSACPLSYSAASGPVHNPWARGFNAGGSSSGSGVLVAASIAPGHFGDVVDLAIGGDQGGSIRLPAAYNGIYGLKPTHGLVPYTGIASLSPMIDHAGPMAAKLEDVALLLKVLAGYDGLDARMTPESPLRAAVKDYPGLLSQFQQRLNEGKEVAKGFKVGLLKESFAVLGLDVSVRDAVYESAKRYFTAAGATVIDISVPLHSEGPAIWTAATRQNMAEWGMKAKVPGYLTYAPPHLSPRWPPDQAMHDLLTEKNPALPNIIFAGEWLQEQYGPRAEAKAHRKVFELRAAYDTALQVVDVLVTPVAPTVAMPHPKIESVDGQRSSAMEKLKLSIGSTANLCPFNVSGHPAMAVPCGFGTYDKGGESVKLPIGMQIVAKRWDEETIFKAAALFEKGQKE